MRRTAENQGIILPGLEVFRLEIVQSRAFCAGIGDWPDTSIAKEKHGVDADGVVGI